MISEVVWLVGYRADVEHDCELQFQLRGIEVTSFTRWRYVCTGYRPDIAFSQMLYSASLQLGNCSTFVTTQQLANKNDLLLASRFADIGRDNTFQNFVIRGTVTRDGDFALAF
jgi:hypothetical protein